MSVTLFNYKFYNIVVFSMLNSPSLSFKCSNCLDFRNSWRSIYNCLIFIFWRNISMCVILCGVICIKRINFTLDVSSGCVTTCTDRVAILVVQFAKSFFKVCGWMASLICDHCWRSFGGSGLAFWDCYCSVA